MKKPPGQVRWRWCRLSLYPVVPALLVGCCSTSPWLNIDNGAVVPPGSTPAPNGAYVNAHINAQAAKAERDDFVIYLHEWYMTGDTLGPYGQYHLGQIIRRLPKVPFPVLIEVVQGNDLLNVARRNTIVTCLTNAGVPDAAQRVLIGFPEPHGLYGDEIQPIYQQMIQRSGGVNQFGTGFGRNLLPGLTQQSQFIPGFTGAR